MGSNPLHVGLDEGDVYTPITQLEPDVSLRLVMQWQR